MISIFSASGNGWFDGRKDHFVRQVIDGFFYLSDTFHAVYSAYLECLALSGNHDTEFHCLPACNAWEELLAHLSAMVGTENCNGPLWKLKDLCHQIWPQEQREQQVNGVLFDWLIGSLFHKAMKLKEDLYLLNNYGQTALAFDGVVDRRGAHRAQVQTLSRMIDAPSLFKRISADVVRQVERLAFTFGKVNFHLRIMLPDLMENVLVVRLLAEREDKIVELWGESLESLLEDVFFGQASAGFCLAGASYLRGQWFRHALAMYRRAMSSDQYNDEAIVKIAQIEAILKDFPDSFCQEQARQTGSP